MIKVRSYSRPQCAVFFGAVFSLAVAASAAALADSPLPAPSADPHDISGVWKGATMREIGRMGMWRPVEGGEPPFTPAGEALYKKRRDADKATHPFHPLGTECAPLTFPGTSFGNYQIIQTPGQVTVLVENNTHEIHVIHMNGKHPENVPATFTGHSIGHWEGDTLVIDTVGFHEDRWFDYTGTPAGSQLHIIERIKKINIAGKTGLEAMVTIIDPENYTRPWTLRRVSHWSPGEGLQEVVCEGDLDKVRPTYIFDKTVPGVVENP
jgi:hypothetical protein